MKNYQYLKQLFAEEPDTGEGEPDKKEPEKKGPAAKYTDDDVDRIISEKFAKWQEKKDKEISEAKKLAEMSAQQKAEYERDELQKELTALKSEKARNELAREARKQLTEGGISVDDDLLGMIVASDAETTQKNVTAFKKLFEGTVHKAVTEALKGGAPKKGGSSGDMTKEQIMAVKDPAERQKLIAENIELFK